MLLSHVVTLSCSSGVEFPLCTQEVLCTIAPHQRCRTSTCPRFHRMAIGDERQQWPTPSYPRHDGRRIHLLPTEML